MQVETTQPSRLAAVAVPSPRAPAGVHHCGVRYVAVDAGMLIAAVAASSVTAPAGWPAAPWTLAFCLLTLALFRRRGLYALRLRDNVLDDLGHVATTTTVAVTTLVTLRLIVAGAPGALQGLLRPWAFAFVFLAAGRTALHMGNVAAGRRNARRVLVVGSGRVAGIVA